jgi:hypothetical protein
VAFIPPFAMQELAEVIGPDKLASCFFGDRSKTSRELKGRPGRLVRSPP